MSAEKQTLGKIMIIDDEPDLRELTKMTLEAHGYTMETAVDGVDGLEKLESFQPDLIVLDMNMPRMGGLEFYQNICEDGDRPKYPVLVLTARANMEQMFKEFNVDGFMSKPFEIEELLHEVQSILQKHAEPAKMRKVVMGRNPFHVCLAENNEERLIKIGTKFLSSGYIVNPADNGTEALERISLTVPDVAIINVDLPDISGDMVALKLKQMSKTKFVRCILYASNTCDKTEIMEQLRRKEGFEHFVEYHNPQDLIETVQTVLRI